MRIMLNGICQNCGTKLQFEFDSLLNNVGGSFYSTKCPHCGEKTSPQCMERLYRICDALVTHALKTDSFVIDSIELVHVKEDPPRPTAQQVEQMFQKERLKELEAEFGDHE